MYVSDHMNYFSNCTSYSAILQLNQKGISFAALHLPHPSKKSLLSLLLKSHRLVHTYSSSSYVFYILKTKVVNPLFPFFFFSLLHCRCHMQKNIFFYTPARPLPVYVMSQLITMTKYLSKELLCPYLLSHLHK